MRDGCRVMPELYKVPYDKVAAEKQQRGTQERQPDGAMFTFDFALFFKFLN